MYNYTGKKKGDSLWGLALGFGSIGCGFIFVWLLGIAATLGVLAAAVWVVIQVLKGTGVL